MGQKVSIQGCRELWTQGRQVDEVILRQVIDGLLGGILMQLATLLMVVQLFAPMHGGDVPQLFGRLHGQLHLPGQRECLPGNANQQERPKQRPAGYRETEPLHASPPRRCRPGAHAFTTPEADGKARARSMREGVVE